MSDELNSLLSEYDIREKMGESAVDPNNSTKIMIVDDDKGVRDGLGSILRDYYLVFAVDGFEAIELVDEKVYCVVMDAKMPKMDGFEATIKINEIYPDIPIIMHTAFHGEHRTSDVISYHFFDYVEKGANISKLKLSVRNACKQYRLFLDNEGYRKDLERKVEERTKENAALIVKLQVEKSISLRGALARDILHHQKNALNQIGPNLFILGKKIKSQKQLITEMAEDVDKDKYNKKLEKEKITDEIVSEIIPLIEDGIQKFRLNYESLDRLYRDYSSRDIKNDLLGIVNINRINFEQKGIAIETMIGELPSVENYGKAANEVYINLMQNAYNELIKRKEEGQRELKILIKAWCDDKLYVEFHDNGSGISETKKEHIFELLGAGKGIGLSTSKQIVDNFGGRIYNCESDITGYTNKFVVEYDCS